MPMATMADAHREWHTNTGVPMGTPGCPQDACHPVDEGEPTHQVQTAYGLLYAWGLEEAKAKAREAAMATGKRAVIQAYVDPTPAPAPVAFQEPGHDTPCVCGPYDRCAAVRAADAQRSGNWRDQFRAYND